MPDSSPRRAFNANEIVLRMQPAWQNGTPRDGHHRRQCFLSWVANMFVDPMVDKLVFLNGPHGFGAASPLGLCRLFIKSDRIGTHWPDIHSNAGRWCTGYETYLGKGKFNLTPIQDFIARFYGRRCRIAGIRKGSFTMASVILVHLHRPKTKLTRSALLIKTSCPAESASCKSHTSHPTSSIKRVPASPLLFPTSRPLQRCTATLLPLTFIMRSTIAKPQTVFQAFFTRPTLEDHLQRRTGRPLPLGH